jgi:hypothetical protein
MYPGAAVSDHDAIPSADDVKAAAKILGKYGGRLGGLARAAKLSPERRTAIASKAAQKRWDKIRQEQGTTKMGSRERKPKLLTADVEAKPNDYFSRREQ